MLYQRALITLKANWGGKKDAAWFVKSIGDAFKFDTEMFDLLIRSISIIAPKRVEHFKTSKQGAYLQSLLSVDKAQEYIDFSKQSKINWSWCIVA